MAFVAITAPRVILLLLYLTQLASFTRAYAVHASCRNFRGEDWTGPVTDAFVESEQYAFLAFSNFLEDDLLDNTKTLIFQHWKGPYSFDALSQEELEEIQGPWSLKFLSIIYARDPLLKA